MSQPRPMVIAAIPGDFGAIATLNVEAFREFAGRMSADAWQKMKERVSAIESRAPSTRFLVVREQGTIVGSVGYCPAGNVKPESVEIFPADWAAVVLLAVAPAYRGHGIARALVSACIASAREDSAPAIGLITSELMTGAQRLYQSLGFHCECEIPPRLGLRYWRYRLLLQST